VDFNDKSVYNPANCQIAHEAGEGYIDKRQEIAEHYAQRSTEVS